MGALVMTCVTFPWQPLFSRVNQPVQFCNFVVGAKIPTQGRAYSLLELSRIPWYMAPQLAAHLYIVPPLIKKGNSLLMPFKRAQNMPCIQ